MKSGNRNFVSQTPGMRDDYSEVNSSFSSQTMENAKRNLATMSLIEDGDIPDGDVVNRLYEHYPVTDCSGKVVPSEKEQLRGDINFDTFGLVKNGFGLGENNKMYQMELKREKRIHMKDNTFFPRPWDGPIDGPDKPPVLVQNVMSKNALRDYTKKKLHDKEAARRVMDGYSNGMSTGVLGYDVGYILDDKSDKGLKRNRMSVLEPIIMNTGAFTRVEMNTGLDMRKNGLRQPYDAYRNDEDFSQNKRPRFSTDGKTLSQKLANPYMQPLL
jgi:hypothetical protein